MAEQAKKPVKKGVGIHKSGLSAWKEKSGMAVEVPKEDEVVEVSKMTSANKEYKWITMPKAFQEATKLPGVLTCCVSGIWGHSNVGKTTFINHAIASAQRTGYIPVIFDTENSFSFQYAKSMGFQAEPVYGNVEVEHIDPETGEVTTSIEKQIINWDGDFIYYNNAILAERFGDIDYQTGKKVSKKRNVAVVEDVAHAIMELLDAQDNGEIDRGFLFCWDSVGSIGCFKDYSSASKIPNPMWGAAAVNQAFGPIVNDRIPASMKASSKYENTFLYVQRVWLDSTSNPVGIPTMQPRNGKGLYWATRCCFQMGSQLTSGIKRLTAASKGLTYTYGIQTKIKVIKNHLNAPYNVCFEDSIVATDTGFIGVNELDEYKKTHVSHILKKLNEMDDGKFEVKANEITFGETEEGETE
jgi:hypothetical protein